MVQIQREDRIYGGISMKVFIYIACFFVMVIIQVVVQNSGIILGAIPTVILYLVAIGAARGLCKLWDNKGRK